MPAPKFGDADGEICPNCKNLVGGERELAQKIWDITRRATIITTDFDDPFKVEMDISDWREMCELLYQSRW